VFVDIDPVSYNIDPQRIEPAVTPRTKAVLPVHLFGQCADMDSIRKAADRRGLAVIEDAAQSLGAEYRGRRSGCLGTAACFSFYPTKNLGAYGDAGMVVTSDPEWAKKMVRLRVHGMEPRYYHRELGWNARLDAIHAAVLRVKLPHLERWIGMRQAAARRYDGLLVEHHLDAVMQRPAVLPQRRHTFNQYVVRVPAELRDGLVRHLKAERVGCEIYYPVPLHVQECLAPRLSRR
jgi:dTDP-4-amino-4,6-dideoxygalactose transaminase